MPELPEVETIKRGLASKIKGKIISSVLILDSGSINVSSKKFALAIKNAQIINIDRRAKILIIKLSNGFSLLAHLKMTGQMLFKPKFYSEAGFSFTEKTEKLKKYFQKPEFKHTRLVFFFKDGDALIFNDLRKFGYIKLVSQDKINEFTGKEKLGMEPLTNNFTIDRFKGILNKHPRRKIKQILTDQALIAGIGNIYSDEICAFADISPMRTAGKLSDMEANRLYQGIKEILLKAIGLRGTSVDNYLDVHGKQGGYAKNLLVYGREGEKCFNCNEEIKRVKIGGRSSYFCPICQR